MSRQGRRLKPETEEFCERRTQSRVARAQGWNGTLPNGPEMMYTLVLSRPVGLRNNEVQQEYCTRVRPRVLHSCPAFSEKMASIGTTCIPDMYVSTTNLSGNE
jgi:hypothetical protein